MDDETIHDRPAQQRIARFYAISQQLSADFATLTLLDAMQGKTERSREARSLALFSHAGFEAWSRQHGSVFQQHLAQQLIVPAAGDADEHRPGQRGQRRAA